MRTLGLILVMVLFLCLSGCETVPLREVYTTRLQTVTGGGGPYVHVDHFGPGEVPVVYVAGYGGDTVNIKILNIANGSIVMNETGYISQGMNQHWRLPVLSRGSYKVELYVSGTLKQSCMFNIFD